MAPHSRITKRKQKLSRERKLYEAVKKKPLNIHEAQKLLKHEVSKRMVENYFADLKALGLVEYDPEAKIYQASGLKKQVFETKQDYNLALEHSRLLLSTTKERRGFDRMHPIRALDELVFNDHNHYLDLDTIRDKECILEHLQTGYYKEIYTLMERYRQLMDETGLSKGAGLPKLPPEEKATSRMQHTKGRHVNTEEIVITPLGGSGRDIVREHNLPPQIAKRTLKEIYYLRNMLVGKIYSIVNDVRHGIPLRGSCENCPNQKLTIKK